MYEFFLWLFKKRTEPFEISFLNFFHILYFAVILITTIALSVYLSKNSDKRKRALRRLAYALLFLYLFDFSIQPFVTSDFTLNIDKLPFHLCTVLAPVVAFTEFNPKFKRIKEPVAFLAVASAVMYIVYPGSAIGDISPFTYKILQTFIYHGVLFAWGVNTILSGEFTPSIKNAYKSLIGILAIAVWATFGNITYNKSYLDKVPDAPHSDWFFLTGSSFDFLLPPYVMPFVTIGAVFGTVLALYGIYYLLIYFYKRKNKKSSQNGD